MQHTSPGGQSVGWGYTAKPGPEQMLCGSQVPDTELHDVTAEALEARRLSDIRNRKKRGRRLDILFVAFICITHMRFPSRERRSIRSPKALEKSTMNVSTIRKLKKGTRVSPMLMIPP